MGWLVVEFPGSRFTGEIAPILDDLVNSGTIRVPVLILIWKAEDGSLDFYELSDLDESEIGGLRSYETALAMLLSEQDVAHLAAAVEPGSTAALLVGEPLGRSVRLRGAPRRRPAGGHRRIPIQALAAAIEADEGEED